MDTDTDTSSNARLEETLPKDAYVSHDAYRRELERIFYRQWVCVARDEAIPEAGDFLRLAVADESVIVTRTRTGEVRGFYNVCRHRGSQLVPDEPPPEPEGDPPAPAGRFRGSIVCPYHAWTYGLDGQLRAAPFLDERHGLRRDMLPLHPIGIERWGGFIFANLTPEDAPPFAEQIGPTHDRTRRYPLPELRTAARVTYEVDANWKVVVENYNECYHCGPVHPELCEIVPAFKRDGGADLDWEAGIPHRPGAWTFTASGTTTRRPFPALSSDERERHKGELLYPNLMLSLSPDHVAAFMLRPSGPGHTTIVFDLLFDPDEMRRPDFDPSDASGFWDLVNRQDWRICESVQRGMTSRAFRTGYYAPMEDLSLDIRRYLAEHLDADE
ncbi:MAG: aromatic ring-hydroxylating dioxygenase subunit alpha [Actinomycetota bacterium]